MIPKLREYSGPVSVVAVTGEQVQTRRVTGGQFAAARGALGPPLGAPGTFESLVAALMARP